jgi:hypothetical protein
MTLFFKRGLQTLVALVTFFVLAGAAQAALVNPHIAERDLWRMQRQYGQPLALPEWLPAGYRYKGHVAFKQHSLTVGYVRGGRLIWFMLIHRYTGCGRREWLRRDLVPRAKAVRGCEPGAGLFFVWSRNASLAQVTNVGRNVGLPWRENEG